ncbi:MAG: Flp family type IVb pilin [Acidobacteria bacterium]|nr:Flp family type IVb pilin [Acidobacteriota bacterium]
MTFDACRVLSRELVCWKFVGNLEEIMIKDFIRDEQGQDIVEYSLLLVLIGAAAIFVLTTMGASISSIFNKINTRLTSANNSIS